MPCFLWQRLQLALPWKQLGLEREEGEREIKGRLSSSSLRGSCHPRQEIFQDVGQRAKVKLFPSHPPK